MRRRPTLLVPVVLLTACADGTSAPADAPSDTAPLSEPPPPLERTTCGADTAPLLDLPQGDLIEATQRPDLDLPRGLLNLAIDELGVDLPAFPHDVRGATFRYATQDKGAPVEATGLLLVPKDVEGPVPVVLSLHFFHGVLPGCPPSDSEDKWATAALLAAHGYAVVAPDFIGLSEGDVEQGTIHAPLVTEQVALGAWDGLIAGRQALQGPLASMLPSGASLADQVVIWGASQGGHAALATAHLQPWAAPDVDLAAVVALVPPHDLLGAFTGLADEDALSDRAGLGALVLWGMHRWYDPPEPLTALFTESVVADLEVAQEDGPLTCDSDGDPERDTVAETYAPAFLAAEAEGRLDTYPPVDCWLEANSLSTNPNPHLSQAPTLVVYGEQDTVVDPARQGPDLPALCDAGWQITARTCSDTDHATAAFASLPDQLAFLEQALGGTLGDPDCTIPEPAPCAIQVPDLDP